MVNTLAIARKLSAAGVEQAQAEAHAETIANAVEKQHGETATKDFVGAKISDVEVKISAVEVKISAVEAKISTVEAKISALEVRLVRWVVGTAFTVAGLLFAALRFIP